MKAYKVLIECVDKYFKIAISYYIASIKRGIPIRIFEIYYIPTITYNEDFILSLYYDKYLYSGGAHGSTYRTSDSWDVKNDICLKLNSILKNNSFNQTDYIKQKIIKQIEINSKSKDFNYFENIIENVSSNFNINNFYLVPSGIKFYFQQYEIAPYASGIPEFFIPIVYDVKIETCRN